MAVAYSEAPVIPAERTLEEYQADPVLWGNEQIGDVPGPWARQIDILESVRDNARTVVKSGHGIGKTWVAARAALWFLLCYPPAIVLTTAPTWRQVERLLWGEIRKQHRSSQRRLTRRDALITTALKLDDDHYALGLSTDQPERFQGYHAEHMLVIFDEAPGVDTEIWEAAEGILTGAHSRWLCIGNPIRPEGNFWDACTSSEWNCISVSCLQHPNVVEGRPIYRNAVTREWVDERREKWGEDDARYKARVLGEFPDSADDMLIPMAWLERAKQARVEPRGERIMGVDVARYGQDRSVILIRDDVQVIAIEIMRGQDTMRIAGRVQVLAQKHSVAPKDVKIDVIGIGAGVVDRLHERGFRCTAINFAEAAVDKTHFANKRAECYWLARERLDPKREAFALNCQHCDELREELLHTPYEYKSNGQMKLPEKERIKETLGRSPDVADAFAQTFGRRVRQPRFAVVGA